jgi:diacylglycerol kinase family enzyme
MRRAVILYNPRSGRANPATIERIASALRTQNLDVATIPTLGPNTAGAQTAAADTDILFACGGDGTIHEVLQGLISHPNITLGVVSWVRLHRLNPLTQTLSTDAFSCGPGLTSPIRVQADGEPLGHTPMTVTIIPDALRILLP